MIQIWVFNASLQATYKSVLHDFVHAVYHKANFNIGLTYAVMECDICNKTTKEYYILFYKLFNPALLSKGGARLDWRARTSRCSLWRIKMKELTWIQWNSSTINTRKYCTYLSCTPRVTHGWICSVYLEKKREKRNHLTKRSFWLLHRFVRSQTYLRADTPARTHNYNPGSSSVSTGYRPDLPRRKSKVRILPQTVLHHF